MPLNLPCPNPVCTHVFSQAEVQRAASLTCPRCGHVFQLRAGAAPLPPRQETASKSPVVAPPPGSPTRKLAEVKVVASAKPAVLIAKPVLAPTAARPPAAKPPVAPAVAASAPTVAKPANPAQFQTGPTPAPLPPHDPGNPLFATEDDGTLVRPRYVRRKWGWKQYTAMVLFLAVVGGLTAWAARFMIEVKTQLGAVAESRTRFPVMVRTLKNVDERAFLIVVPEDTWEHDSDIRPKLGVQLALKHREQPAWIAAGAKDFGTQRPRDAELINQGIDKLKELFEDSLELADKATPAMLAGQTSQRLEFKGSLKTISYRGECYTIAHHGFGYWFFIAAPTALETQHALEEFQADNKGFILATERKGWREQPPDMEKFFAADFPLEVAAPKDVWEKYSNLADEDAAARLYLVGRYRLEKDNRKNASVLAIVLGKQESAKDAMKSARGHLEEKKKEEDKGYKFVNAAAGDTSDEGDKAAIGNRPGRLAELKVLHNDEPKRYMLVAVINEPDNVVVVRGECTWESRQIWRQEFLDLLATLKIRKE